MTTDDTDLPALDLLFDTQRHRLQGIASWEQVAGLGSANIERLLQLAQEGVQGLMVAGTPRSELYVPARGITQLRAWQKDAPRKPLLPRLRVESFHKEEPVLVYIGDTPGHSAPTDGVRAHITAVRKAHRPEWRDGSPNGGYYWRWTATAQTPFWPGQNSLDFSTSEPRVLPAWEFDYLREAWRYDAAFLEIFSDNARRPWQPLWCLERRITCAVEAMDMKAWLLTGSFPESVITPPGF